MTRRRLIRGLLGLFLALLIALGGAVAWATTQIRVPPWRRYDGPFLKDGFVEPNDWAHRWWAVMTVDDLPFPHEDVEALAADRSTLRGWFWAAPSPTASAVLLVHGGGADRRSMLKYATFIREAGYAVAAFDLRDHGTSDGDRRGLTFGHRESQDVEAQVAWLERRGYDRIAVLGDSVGAASAIEAAARDHRIDAVIAQNGYADFEDFVADILADRGAPRFFGRLVALACERTWPGPARNVRPEDTIALLAPRPVLVLQGADDELCKTPHAERLYAAAQEPKELYVMPGARHATLWNTDPAAFEKRVLSFLAKALPVEAPAQR